MEKPDCYTPFIDNQVEKQEARCQTGLILKPRRYQTSQILNVSIEWYNFQQQFHRVKARRRQTGQILHASIK